MAERAGFEPAVPFLVHLFSKQGPSSTQPPLRIIKNINKLNLINQVEWIVPDQTMLVRDI